jgi:hypothetical protein
LSFLIRQLKNNTVFTLYQFTLEPKQIDKQQQVFFIEGKASPKPGPELESSRLRKNRDLWAGAVTLKQEPRLGDRDERELLQNRVALAKMKTARKKHWRAEKKPSADLRGQKWEQASANTFSREQREQKKSFRESFKLDGTLPERERNRLAQDKIRKENFSAKRRIFCGTNEIHGPGN